MGKRGKRFAALLLSAAMACNLFTGAGSMVLAQEAAPNQAAALNQGAAPEQAALSAEKDGLCKHHPQHTPECGYREAKEAAPCGHEHGEACYQSVTKCCHVHTPECYPAVNAGADPAEGTADGVSAVSPAAEGTAGGVSAASPASEGGEAQPTACTHVCSVESGCVIKELHCVHTHDENCGYAEAVEGQACKYVSEPCPACAEEAEKAAQEAQQKIKAVQALINALPEADSITADTLENVKGQLAAIEEAKALLDENSQTALNLSRYTAAAEKAAALEAANNSRPEGDSETGDESGPEQPALSEEAAKVQERIDALPSIEEVEEMDEEARKAAYEKTQEAYDAYEKLSEEEQALLDITKLEALFAYFNEMTAMAAEEETSPFVVTGGTYGTDYEWSDTDKKLTINTSGAFTISMKDGVSTPVTAQIVAGKSGGSWIPVNLTLAGVNITAPTNAGGALFTGGSLTINLTGSNTLTGSVISNGAIYNTYGIYASGALTISGGGTLNATGGAITSGSSSVSSRSVGIESSSSVTISGGTVNASGGSVSNGDSGSSSCGIRACGESLQAIHISGGSVTATGGSVTGISISGSYGMYGSPNITGGSVTATGGEATARSYGIYAGTGSCTISGGSGTAKTTAVNAATKQAMDQEPNHSTVAVTAGAYNSPSMSWVPLVHVTGVSLNKSTMTLVVGDSDTLTAAVEPADATNKSVTWSSSDDTVATVDGGVVTAVKAGTATITVTTTDGSKTATCTVTVVEPKNQQAPAKPTIAGHTKDSITLTAVAKSTESGAAAKYSRDGGTTWQDSPEFTGLTNGTEYTFVVRYPAVDGWYASPASEGRTAKIDHAFGSEWKLNETQHWHVCACGEKDAVSDHTFTWITDKEAQAGVAGSKHEKCTVCGFEKPAVEIPALPAVYPPVIKEQEGGNVEVDNTNPKPGDKVTILPKPEEGNEVAEIVVTDQDGKSVAVTDNGDGTYSFIQPEGAVTIKAVFEPESETEIETESETETETESGTEKKQSGSGSSGKGNAAPATGDSTNLMGWILTLIAALACLGGAVVYKKKKG